MYSCYYAGASRSLEVDHTAFYVQMIKPTIIIHYIIVNLGYYNTKTIPGKVLLSYGLHAVIYLQYIRQQ